MGDKKLRPPKFNEEANYEEWSRRIKWWQIETDIAEEKQGIAIASSLTGKALEAVLQLEDEKINCKEGCKNVMDKLDAVYQKNTLTKKIEDIEVFETLRRKDDSVKQFIIDFERCVSKLKVHKIEYPSDVRGYKLLKGANLPPNEEKMVRASCATIDYDTVHAKLKGMYGDDKPATDNFNLKAEPTFLTEAPDYDEGRCEDEESEYDEEAGDIMYTSKYRRGNSRNNQYGRPPPNANQRRQVGAPPGNWRDRQETQYPKTRGKNPLNKFGAQTRCRICQSVNHWENKCPDKEVSDTTLLLNEVVLHANNDTVLRALLAETWSCAVLDCGATNTVCGTKWFEEFKSSLTPALQDKIVLQDSSKPFRFGDGVIVNSTKRANIPAFIGQNSVQIVTEIVDADIPLLLSIKAMKKGNLTVDFGNDQLIGFGQKIPLQTAANGLYALPLTKSRQLMTNFVKSKDDSKFPIAFKVTNVKSNKEIALKLHRSFAHPSAERLLRMINAAGKEWSSNETLKDDIRQVSENCEVCKIYKKAPARPSVGLPTATEFNEMVGMDLKQYDSKIILHLVDLCTRLSAACFIPNKKPSTIVNAIFKIWIAIYGSPIKFLSDNGGEFANTEFLSFCESLGITVKTTPAESPWSNGIVERNNQTIARSMDKIIEDTKCSNELALCWALNAKNALMNVAGFSPFQLVLGTNPRLPSCISDNTPALTQRSTSKLIQDNLNALHAARTAFISCENDEKIRRVLRSNVRGSGDIKYLTGDEVLYKRNDSVQWHGPATVIGQVDQQVFVKHGSFYVRVHPCRLQLVRGAARTVTQLTGSNQSVAERQPSTNVPIYSNNEAITDSNDQIEIPTTSTAVSTPNEESQQVDTQEELPNEDVPAVISQQAIEDAPSTSNPIETNVQVQSANDSPSLSSIKPGMKVKYQDFSGSDQPIHQATIKSRAGKAKGKYSAHWNTERNDGSDHIVDFSDVHSWEIQQSEPDATVEHQPDTTVEHQSDTLLLACKQSRELEAKMTELNQWKDMGVYKEVENQGQDCISLRWVLKDKLDNSGSVICKARLCVRGFEEEQNFRTDSPTCSREGIRLFFAATAANGWKLHSMDVKGAFLQGKEIDREVFLKPPKEANTSKLWLLIKCAYGLADAPRCWYLRMREELMKLGARPSKLDNGIFAYESHGTLFGLVVLYVDDIMWSGKESRMKSIIDKIKAVFKISHETDEAFNYVGMQVTQDADCSIHINQSTYVESINPICLPNERMSENQSRLSNEETTMLRGVLGQLNWIANMTRPDISYTVSSLSSCITHATIADIKTANKAVKFVKDTPSQMKFPALCSASIGIVAHTDASFNNHDDGGSQGGQIIFVSDDRNHSCPISWRSNRVRRVARSTLAAETLSFADGMDTAQFVRRLAEDIQLIPGDTTIRMITDSRSLFDASNTSSQITDRRLRVEMSAIRESKEKGEIQIVWTSGDKQLADCLTKKGASPLALQEVVNRGMLQA